MWVGGHWYGPPGGPRIGKRRRADLLSQIGPSLIRVSNGTRTRDILDHNQVLYQLSYTHHDRSSSRPAEKKCTGSERVLAHTFPRGCPEGAGTRATSRRPAPACRTVPRRAGRTAPAARACRSAHCAARPYGATPGPARSGTTGLPHGDPAPAPRRPRPHRTATPAARRPRRTGSEHGRREAWLTGGAGRPGRATAGGRRGAPRATSPFPSPGPAAARRSPRGSSAAPRSTRGCRTAPGGCRSSPDC